MVYTVGAFIFYLLMMLFIGFYFTNKSSGLGAYYLGDRKMNKWVVALSAQASDMSGWLLMGLPGAVYLSGISEAWIGVGLGVGTYLNWKIVARRLRTYSHKCGDAITIPDFFSNRFRDTTGLMRTISALVILFFFTFYTASGFGACAKLFSSTFNMNTNTALILGAAVIVSYTLLGGFMAVCWTDVIQGVIMFFAIVAVPAAVVLQTGGFSASVAAINSIDSSLLNIFTSAKDGSAISLVALISSLVWGLGYFGMPHILVRFMAIDRAEKITDSRRIAMVWVVVSLAAAVAVGLVGRILAVREGIVVDDPEKIFMILVSQLFHPLVIGVFMSAILAAIMSTADSQLLVAASAFSNDFYKRVIRPKAGNRELIFVSRLTVAAVAIVSVYIAWFVESSAKSSFSAFVMDMVSFAWAGFGASFGPLMLLSLFWKRVNLAGAASGMAVGAITTVVWKFFLSPHFAADYPIFGLYELAPGFAASFVVTVLVSLLTPPPSKDIVDEFERVASQSPELRA